MSVISTLTIPPDEFVLGHTLGAMPTVEFGVEGTAEHDSERVFPLVWATSNGRGEDELDGIERTLRADPSVERVALLADCGDRQLYAMEWASAIGSVTRALVEEGGTVLNAWGRANRWSFRVLFPDHDVLSRTSEYCEAKGISVDVERVHRLNGDTSGWFGLTEMQYATLVTATKRGFYDIPRAVTQTDLATELGISHQALSERLRRAQGQLARNTLLVEGATNGNR